MNRRGLLAGMALLPIAAVPFFAVDKGPLKATLGSLTTIVKVSENQWIVAGDVRETPAFKFQNCGHTSFQCSCRYSGFERIA